MIKRELTILNGQTTSVQSLALGNRNSIFMIASPANLNGIASLTFLVSHDTTTWYAGALRWNGAAYTFTATAGSPEAIDPLIFAAPQVVKIVANTAAGANTTFEFFIRPL